VTQAVKTRLNRLETLSGGAGRVLVVLEDMKGALTLGGVPWAKDEAGVHDTVLIVKSFVGAA